MMMESSIHLDGRSITVKRDSHGSAQWLEIKVRAVGGETAGVVFLANKSLELSRLRNMILDAFEDYQDRA